MAHGVLTTARQSWLALAATAQLLLACEGYLDLEPVRLVEAEPTLEAVVGPLCGEYCDAVTQYCSGPFQVYANPVQCLSLCGAMLEGEPGADRGDTVHCRLTHARSARDTAEPESHCPQAGRGGAAGVEDAPSCATNCLAPGDASPIISGQLIAGKYRVESLLGIGGMGLVVSAGTSSSSAASRSSSCAASWRLTRPPCSG
jgi:hypothetical protein